MAEQQQWKKKRAPGRQGEDEGHAVQPHDKGQEVAWTSDLDRKCECWGHGEQRGWEGGGGWGDGREGTA